MTKSQFAMSTLFSALLKGRFEINKSLDGQFYWVLKSGNGQVICVSEMYVTKQSAKEGVALCVKHAASAQIYDLS